MKKLTPKTGMLAVALAKVRSLKTAVNALSDDLIEMNHRNAGLRDANAHATVACADAQNGIKLLKAELLGKCEEVNMLNLWNDNLKTSLRETETHRDNLYEANQKFADDDHAYRLSSVKNINQLTNDNLHLAEEVIELRTTLSNVRGVGQAQLDELEKKVLAAQEASSKYFGISLEDEKEINKRDLKIAALQQTLDRERASHTMTFLAKCERIDELLLNDRELTNRIHSLDIIIARRDDQITALFAELRTHETNQSDPSWLSRVWQWLNSPY